MAALGKLRVHAEEISGKQCRFFAARSRANFQNRIVLVGFVARQQQCLDFVTDNAQLLFELQRFLACQVAHVRVRFTHELPRLGKLVIQMLKAFDSRHQRPHVFQFFQQRHGSAWVGGNFRPGQFVLEAAVFVENRIVILCHEKASASFGAYP